MIEEIIQPENRGKVVAEYDGVRFHLRLIEGGIEYDHIILDPLGIAALGRFLERIKQETA